MNDRFGDSAKERRRIKRLARQWEVRLQESDSSFIDLLEVEPVFHFFLEEGSFQLAEKLVTSARGMYPRSALVAQWAALLALEQGQTDDAITYASEAVEAAPEESRHRLLYAEALTRDGQYEEARDILEAMMDDVQFPEEVLLQLGDISQVQGDFRTSEDYYRQALTVNPDFSPAIGELAALLEVQGEEARSIALFTSYLERNPYAADTWYELGSLQARLELFEDALDAFEYCLVIRDDFSEAYYRKALCLMALARFEEALPVLLEVLNRKHVEPHVHYHTAVCYERLAMFADAGRHFHLAATQDHHHADAWRGLARTFAQRENYVEAIHAYQKALDIEDDQAETYLDLAICEYKLGNRHTAGTHMQQALKLDDDNPDIWLNWASVLVSDEKLGSAIELLEAGISIKPALSPLYYRCAAYLYAAGRDNASFYLLEQGLVLDEGEGMHLCEVVPDFLEDPATKRLVKRYAS